MTRFARVLGIARVRQISADLIPFRRQVSSSLCSIVIIAAIWAAATFASLSPAEAKLFKSSYVSFELPDRWNCEFRDTEWVCRNELSPQTRREAVIILTAKEVGAQDTFVDYEGHLKSPRALPSRTGVSQPSKIYRVVQRKIAEQNWVDGMHLSSEVPNYYTRYLATIREKIAILVTFSAHTSVYSRYVQDFFRAIESLRVTVARSQLAGGAGGADSGGVIGPGGGLSFPDLPPEVDPEAGSGGGLSGAAVFMSAGVILAAIGLYLLIKKKQKDRKPGRGGGGGGSGGTKSGSATSSVIGSGSRTGSNPGSGTSSGSRGGGSKPGRK